MSYSAGVLLYRIVDGDLRFLLGKDRRYEKWSDFGGKSSPGDKNDRKLTAARECFEETCGVILGTREIYSQLRDDKVIVCNSFSNNVYYMYLLDLGVVQFDPCDVFRKQLGIVRNMKHNAKYLEKVEMRWFDASKVTVEREKFRNAFYNSVHNNAVAIQDRVRI